MFVSVIRDGHHSLYECARLHMKPCKDEHEIWINLESDRPGGAVALVIDKRTTVVDVKNHDGKSIDTYDWPAAYQAKAAA